MPFTLQITFRGMSFFVPDAEEGRMHVLMPAAGHHHGHGEAPVSPHHALLSYPARQVDPDAGPDETRTESLDGRELDLSALPTESKTLALPRAVANLWEVAGLKIDREQLGPTPRASVAARLRLPAGAEAKPGAAAAWKFDGKDPVRTLTNQVTLEWPQSGESLALRIDPLGAGKPGAPVTMHPIRDGIRNMIRLDVSYLPEIEPDDPTIDQEAPHFHCHYALFEGVSTGPIPRLHGYTEEDSGGGSPYTCLTAGGPPGP